MRAVKLAAGCNYTANLLGPHEAVNTRARGRERERESGGDEIKLHRFNGMEFFNRFIWTPRYNATKLRLLMRSLL